MASSPLPAFAEALSHGIYCIDTGFHRPRFDAAYLIVEDGHAAFVDTGTNFGVPRLLDTLAALGLAPADVDAVIPTHVHLDHAGGVGLLMQALPHATCWVHERGLRHLVDPSALYQGALAVYGQAEMERSYGQLVPVDASRVRATDRRHDDRTRRPQAARRRHARPRTPPPLHLGRSLARLVHWRHVRPELPRVRPPDTRRLGHPHVDAGAVRARVAAVIGAAAAGT